MKVQFNVQTPVGTYTSQISEDLTDAQFEEFVDSLKQSFEYLTFVDYSGDTVIVREGVLKNSVIEIIIAED